LSNFPTIAFIGGGNMAKAIIGGLLESGCPGHNISVVVPTQATRRTLNTMGIEQVSSSPGSREFDADILVLAVKPQKLATALPPLQGKLSGDTTVLSVIAGVTSDTLAQLLGISDIGQIVRCMPNTPSLIGHGVTGVYAADATDTVKVGMICEMLEAIGDVFWLDSEDDLDVITAISGSGPAYFFLFMESLSAAGVSMGFSEEVARKLAVQTALGAGRLAEESPESLAQLRRNVTSPGGTTEQAINAFLQGGLPELVAAAANASKQRSIEISKELAS
jgi:pyrroline-5-carboxylate reductase|tara:strand:+ start:1739 stop:2569 length:831 start_codon:yes stop_codon:yes gene_type:complete